MDFFFMCLVLLYNLLVVIGMRCYFKLECHLVKSSLVYNEHKYEYKIYIKCDKM